MIPTPPPPPGTLPTPQAIITSTPAPTSERAILDAGLDVAEGHAKALDGTLGAMVIDLTSGAVASRNADRSVPMEGVQKVAIGALAYHALDAGTLTLDTAAVQRLVRNMLSVNDSAAEQALIHAIGGIDAVNAALRDLGYDAVVAGSNDDGFATPAALARMLTDVQDGRLVRPSSRAALLETLATVQTFPGGGTTSDAGIVSFRGRTMIVVAMLVSARGTDAARDAVVADVARAAANAAASLTP